MPKKLISTPNAPAAIGPYSQGYIAGDFIFTAGQGGLDPADGHIVSETVEGQAEQAKTSAPSSPWAARPARTSSRRMCISRIWRILPRSTPSTPGTSPKSPPVPALR